ncbi:MAG TPA: DUF3108 domain-containing protein [Steroidobacteraceae bacterium]|nr:DUF3108 domain-containing protein [Steroidobacteraceae bacterium]
MARGTRLARWQAARCTGRGAISLSPRAHSAALLVILAVCAWPLAAHAAADCPQPFKVTFAVEWHGMSAGTSILELVRQGPDEWTYKSSNTARGLFRLALPDTITQVSHFKIEDSTVLPLTYVGDDGSSDTRRDVSLRFDWDAKRVTGTAENSPVDQPITPGVQDSLSVQVALMCALARGDVPASFRLIDKDEVKEYQYTREGEAKLDTAVGKLDTVIYRSQKAGSSRYTRLWIAPSLGYLPVRAEQAKRDKRELQLTIRAVTPPQGAAVPTASSASH